MDWYSKVSSYREIDWGDNLKKTSPNMAMLLDMAMLVNFTLYGVYALMNGLRILDRSMCLRTLRPL